MKLALVGLGRFHLSQHAQALQTYSREVAPLQFLLCDCDENRLEVARSIYPERPAYTSLKRLLADEKPDAAYVTVPPSACCEVVLEILAARIPVFTEKPPGITPDETMRLICAAKGIPHAVGFNRRFHPCLRALKRLAAEQLGGHRICVGCSFLREARYDADFAATAIHGIDALRYLGGDIHDVAIAEYSTGGSRSYRSFVVSGRFESGSLLTMTVLPAAGRAEERYAVTGLDITLEARLSLPGIPDANAVHILRGGKTEIVGDAVDPGMAAAPESVRFGFYDQARTFLEALLTGGNPGTSFSESLQSVELADALRNASGFRLWRAGAAHGDGARDK